MIDPGGIERESCLACLSAEFGFERCEREIGGAQSRVVAVLLCGEPARIGAFVSELAVHGGEIADRLLEEEAVGV